MAALGREAYERQVDAWARELELASADPVDLLYLHHLTPLNEAAARVLPGHPGDRPDPRLRAADARAHRSRHAGGLGAPPTTWAQRLCDWAAGCTRIVVSSPKGLRRASLLLDIDPERFVVVPNGFDDNFEPRRGRPGRALAAPPGRTAAGMGSGQRARQRSLRGGRSPGARGDRPAQRRPLHRGQAAAAPDRGLRSGPRPRSTSRTALVLLGGFPGEWEGEHPLDAIERCGAAGRLPRRLALARGVAGLHQRQRPARARVGQRAVRSGPGRGDGLRAAGDRGRPRRPGRHPRPRRDGLADSRPTTSARSSRRCCSPSTSRWRAAERAKPPAARPAGPTHGTPIGTRLGGIVRDSVRGARTTPAQASSRFSTLPVELRGSESRNSVSRGTL